MSDHLAIKSIFREYRVDFVDDLFSSIEGEQRDLSFFIVDKGLMTLYGARMERALPEDRTFLVEADENNKTMDHCQTLIRTLVGRNIRRNNALFAIGGGILQDITAFIASILYRGIDWYFAPTTLLAQADSCIGSKTSINLGEYKNLVGNFYPPRNIFIETGFLETLPQGELKSGIGEILHFYLIDASPEIEPLMKAYDELLREPRGLKRFIYESLSIKKRVIERDEFDKNERNLFNYGHTFGHALETLTGYGISHGQAVTLGMDLANHVSVELGYMSPDTCRAMKGILGKNMPAFDASGYDLERYFSALARDKKNVGNNLGCILSRGPGEMFKVQIPIDSRLRDIVREYFEDLTGN